MPLRVFLPTNFENAHEQKQFADLVQSFKKRFSNLKSPHVLIGNVLINNAEIDAIYINKNFFHILELKSGGGDVKFSENGDWQADGRIIKGGNQLNPFQQVRKNKFKLLNILKDNENRIFGDSLPKNIIKCSVVFADDSNLLEDLP